MELETATQDIPATFDPALISVPPFHSCPIRSDMSFTAAGAAFDDWFSCPISPDQARYCSRGTMRDNRTKIKALNKFFGPLKLRAIHLGQFREYQKMRFSNGRIYGIPLGGRGHHPAHAVIEDAVKWLSAGGLTDPNQGSNLIPGGIKP